jgi:hypothetical protein
MRYPKDKFGRDIRVGDTILVYKHLGKVVGIGKTIDRFDTVEFVLGDGGNFKFYSNDVEVMPRDNRKFDERMMLLKLEEE